MRIYSYLFFGILLLGCPFRNQAQSIVSGIVSDKQTKQRIANVKLTNLRTHQTIFNNTRGEFSLLANVSDLIIVESKGYYPDTVAVTSSFVLIIPLQKESIYLDEVRVDKRKTPEEKLQEAMDQFSKAYRLADAGSLLSTGQNGAGLSISSIYNLFSKEAKRARILTKTIEKDYRENVIDYRFSKELISKTTGLKGEDLEKFRRLFRPDYTFVTMANEYQMTLYIKECFAKYVRNPNRYFLEPFPTNNPNFVP